MMDPAVVMLDEVDSTNTFGRLHFDDYPDGTLIAARFQTAGHGRQGRRWIAPPGVNFCGSALLKRLGDGFFGGCIAGLAALAAVRECVPGVHAYLKWPNDLCVGDRKLAGILCESARIADGRVTGVVAGIGVNVNLDRAALAAIDQPATSLMAECGHEIPLNFFTKKVAESLIRYYIIYLNRADSIFSEWRAENLLLGERLTVIDPSGGEHAGVFRDLLPDGAMLFETETSGTVEFRCGDVRIDRAAVDWERFERKFCR